MLYKFKILHSNSMGYALFKWNDEGYFWGQCTKWYQYLGNLKRFNHDANEQCYYSIVE